MRGLEKFSGIGKANDKQSRVEQSRAGQVTVQYIIEHLDCYFQRGSAVRGSAFGQQHWQG